MFGLLLNGIFCGGGGGGGGGGVGGSFLGHSKAKAKTGNSLGGEVCSNLNVFGACLI